MAQPFIQGKTLNQHHIALLRQKAQQQQQQQQLQKIQQQRIQQQKQQQQQQQQLKLLQQQQQQQPQTSQAQQQQQVSSQAQSQATKQVQPTLVATTNQLGMSKGSIHREVFISCLCLPICLSAHNIFFLIVTLFFLTFGCKLRFTMTGK